MIHSDYNTIHSDRWLDAITTIRFWMAADAINVSDFCYHLPLYKYIVNLGATMELQVRSSVYSVYFCLSCLFPCLSVVPSQNLVFSLCPCALLCATPLSLCFH